jgi:hypothetical protein
MSTRGFDIMLCPLECFLKFKYLEKINENKIKVKKGERKIKNLQICKNEKGYNFSFCQLFHM